MNETPILDSWVGLHEEIQIIYVVDGYEAILYSQDGQRRAYAHGKTIGAALLALETEMESGPNLD